MTNAEKFWDKLAKRYAKSPVKNMDAYKDTMDHARAHLTQEDGVLEIGCGTGSTALLLAGSVKHITASDISGNMIEIANDKLEDQQVKNITFVKGTVFDDRWEKGSFDVVLAFNFLHLVEDLPATVKRINELLRPGGRFISKAACMGGQRSFWAVLVPVMRALGLAPYVGFMSTAELDEIITIENFEIIETGAFPSTSTSRFIVARKL